MDKFKNYIFQTKYDSSSPQKLFDGFYLPVISSSNLISIYGNGISISNLEYSARGMIFAADNATKINILLTHTKRSDKECETEWSEIIKGEILDEIKKGLSHPFSLRQKKYIEILAWFLKHDIANIKVIPVFLKNKSFFNKHFLSSSNISIYRDNEFQLLCSKRLIEYPDIIKIHWSWGDPEKIAIKVKHIYDEQFNSEQIDLEFSHELTNFILKYCPDTLPDTDPSLEKDEILYHEVKPITLWKHQRKAFEAWFSNECRGIFKMCTGAGKTITALFCIGELAKKQILKDGNLGGIVIACPTKVLVEQWQKELKKFGFRKVLNAYESVFNYINKLAIYLDSSKRKDGRWIIITTYKTFFSDAFRAKIKLAQLDSKPGLLICDEMHNVSSINSRQRLKEYGNFFKYRLGLSATPEIENDISSTNDLMKYFGGIISEYNLGQAISDNVLCSYNYYPIPKMIERDISEKYLKVIEMLENESHIDLYRQKRALLLQSKSFLSCLDEQISKLINEGQETNHTLVFGPPGFDREKNELFKVENRLLAQAKKVLEDYDIVCGAITANTPNNERPKILQDFENGIFKVLLSIGCLDEGMDIPCIKRAIMLYSIDRERQFIQRRGRVLRKYHDKPWADIYDLILLPHNMGWPKNKVENLIRKEMRRYQNFAKMAKNRKEAEEMLNKGIIFALGDKKC